MNQFQETARSRISDMLFGITRTPKRLKALRSQFATVSDQYLAVCCLALAGYCKEIVETEDLTDDSIKLYTRVVEFANAAIDFEFEALQALSLKNIELKK